MVSWWGRPGFSTGDSQGIVTDSLIDKVFEAAFDAGMQVALHLEPYPGRNITTISGDIRYLRKKYDKYPSWYRLPTRRPRLNDAQRERVIKYEEARKAEVDAARLAKKQAREEEKKRKQELAAIGDGGNGTVNGTAAVALDANGNPINKDAQAVAISNATSTSSGNGTQSGQQQQEEDDGPFYSPRIWTNMDPQPVFYVYDSYHIPPSDWERLLMPAGDLSVRGNRQEDGVFVGLWLEKGHGRELAESGFDGAYTYFGTDGFAWGSTQKHWKKMATFARERDMMFVPCVSPGYDDSKIRPWNAANKRDREDGKYYQRSWDAALESKTIYVGITTYNEWGEGTQIEAAIPRSINLTALIPTGKALPRDVREKMRLLDGYSSYNPFEPDHYMMETLRYSAKFADQVGFTEVGKDLRKMEAFHEKQKQEAGIAGMRVIHPLSDDERREAPMVAAKRAKEREEAAANPKRGRFDVGPGPDGRTGPGPA